MSEPHHIDKVPCKSCPYRKDVPSGVWHQSEYQKLPIYDMDKIGQIAHEAIGFFLCHQQTNALCAGWVGCHKPENLVAFAFMPMGVTPDVYDYESPVPLFSSGAEAAAHGMKDIPEPTLEATRTIRRLAKKRWRRLKAIKTE